MINFTLSICYWNFYFFLISIFCVSKRIEINETKKQLQLVLLIFVHVPGLVKHPTTSSFRNEQAVLKKEPWLSLHFHYVIEISIYVIEISIVRFSVCLLHIVLLGPMLECKACCSPTPASKAISELTVVWGCLYVCHYRIVTDRQTEVALCRFVCLSMMSLYIIINICSSGSVCLSASTIQWQTDRLDTLVSLSVCLSLDGSDRQTVKYWAATNHRGYPLLSNMSSIPIHILVEKYKSDHRIAQIFL